MDKAAAGERIHAIPQAGAPDTTAATHKTPGASRAPPPLRGLSMVNVTPSIQSHPQLQQTTKYVPTQQLNHMAYQNFSLRPSYLHPSTHPLTGVGPPFGRSMPQGAPRGPVPSAYSTGRLSRPHPLSTSNLS